MKQTYLPIFVSACYLMLDVARGQLHYANAGHPTPLCVHRARSDLWRRPILLERVSLQRVAHFDGLLAFKPHLWDTVHTSIESE